MSASDTSSSGRNSNGGLDEAVRQLKIDRDRLIGDSRTLAVEAIRALGRTALWEVRKRPFTAAAVIIATVSTALAAAMGRRECARARQAGTGRHE